jgi:L-rhamnose mutarotase
MQRACFRLRVKPERAQEYARRHQAVWPEMQEALRATGWRNYSLFLADDGSLIGYLECDDFEEAVRAMSLTEVNARWQAQMAPFFEEMDASTPDQSMRPLAEIFHID